MSKRFEEIRRPVHKGAVRISEHGYDELSPDGILARELVQGVADAIVVEDYPHYPKGSCVLVLQKDKKNEPIHVVRRIPKGYSSPAVLVTAYRPDPELWESNFLRRRR